MLHKALLVFFLVGVSYEAKLNDPRKIDVFLHRNVPSIPAALHQQQDPSVTLFKAIWEHLLKVRGGGHDQTFFKGDGEVPQIVLVVTSSKMRSLTPDDATNPLFSGDHERLTEDFVLDLLSQGRLNLYDPDLTSSRGVTVKSLTGRDIVFKKNPVTRKLTVNGVETVSQKSLEGAKLVLITLKDFLFDHETQIRDALATPSQSPHHRFTSTIRKEAGPVPQIPSAFQAETGTPNPVLDLWRHYLQHHSQQTALSQALFYQPPTLEPKTMFTFDLSLENLFPGQTSNPLYSEKYSNLVKNIIMDHLTITPVDQSFVRSGQKTIRTLGGKELEIKKDPLTGKLTVNGLEMKDFQKKGDYIIWTITDPLFNYYSEIKETPKTQIPFVTGVQRSIVPKIPSVLRSIISRPEVSTYFSVWNNIEKQTDFLVDEKIRSNPKTLLVVNSFKMNSLAPIDAANPLYSERYSDLTTNFILDHASTENINFNDPALNSRRGLLLKSMTGKDLVFKKNKHTGKLTVNDIEVDDYKVENGQIAVIVVNDMLFNYEKDIGDAYRVLIKSEHSPLGQVHTPIILPDHRTSFVRPIVTKVPVGHVVPTRVPLVPVALKSYKRKSDKHSRFIDVWENQDRRSPAILRDATTFIPKTIVTVSTLRMNDLIPSGGPNPRNTDTYSKLTTDFILDHVSPETLNLKDPALSSTHGVTLKTSTGNDLVFQKDQNTGELTVNGIKIDDYEILPGQLIILLVNDPLFNYAQEIDDAYRTLSGSYQFEKKPVFHTHERFTVAPRIPSFSHRLTTKPEVSTYFKTWQFTQDRTPQTLRDVTPPAEPKTVLVVNTAKFNSLLPNAAANPLYSDKYSSLTTNFFLDHASTENINFNDPALNSRGGLTLKSMAGKDLVFKKNKYTGKLTVNDIEVDDYEVENGQIAVIVVNDMLFNYEKDIGDAYRVLLRSEHIPLGQVHTPIAPQVHRTSFVRPTVSRVPVDLAVRTYTSVPAVPAALSTFNKKSDKHSRFIDVWENQDRRSPAILRDTTSFIPKTIVTVSTFRMNDLIPSGGPNPLDSETYSKLTTDFILDHVSQESVNLNDPALSSTHGATLKTSTGKDLVFKKDRHTGELTVNGIKIEDYESLPGQLNVLLVNDPLFNYAQEIDDAYRTVSGSYQFEKKPVFHTHERFTMAPRIPSFSHRLTTKPEVSTYFKTWQFTQDRTPQTLRDVTSAAEPKTVLVVNTAKFNSLLPNAAANPLYSDKYSSLTTNFFLDHASTENIDFNDPALNSRRGLTLKSMTGKDLVFKKDKYTGKLTVNDIEVDDYAVENGQIYVAVVVVNDMLFNYEKDISDAYRVLLRSEHIPLGQVHTPIVPPVHHTSFVRPTVSRVPVDHAVRTYTSVPAVPAALSTFNKKSDKHSRFIDVWENQDRRSPAILRDTTSFIPKTIVTVSTFRMNDLIPSGGPNPLDSETYSKLTTDFILDHVSPESVNLNDPALSSTYGVTLKTSTGKNLVFKKERNTGELTVNGIKIDDYESLPGQLNVLLVNNPLFNYAQEIDDAYRTLSGSYQFEETPVFHTHERFPVVPKITSFYNRLSRNPEVTAYLKIWEFMDAQKPLSLRDDTSDIEPKTMLVVSTSKLNSLLTTGTVNPLYSDEYFSLTTDFILDHTSTESINFNEPALNSRQGLTLKSMTGKDLVFKRNKYTGDLTVNGRAVATHEDLGSGSTALVLEQPLYDYETKIADAVRASSGSEVTHFSPTQIGTRHQVQKEYY